MNISELIVKLQEYQQKFPDLAEREIEEDEIPYFLEDQENDEDDEKVHHTYLDELIAKLNTIRKNKGSANTEVYFYDNGLDEWTEYIDISYEYDAVFLSPSC